MKINNTNRILVTGGRAPAALELVRILKRSGKIVYVADTISFPISRFSNCCQQYIQVTSPVTNPKKYVADINKIIDTHDIDVVIPTCEEVFHLAKNEEKIKCLIFTDTFELLRDLHSKYNFIKKAEDLNLSVPKTIRFSGQDDFESRKNELPFEKGVAKPEYSRFATKIVISSNIKRESKIQYSQPFVFQEYIEGKHFSSYSVCRKGAVLASAVYPLQYRWGNGATVVFQGCDHKKIQEWIKIFVSANNFSGQIGFDFIEKDNGALFAIECNPRATSGIHLFKGQAEFAECFTTKSGGSFVQPKSLQTNFSVKFALIILALGNAFNVKKTRKLITKFLSSKDVIADKNDLWPAVGQFLSTFEFILISIKRRVGLTDATVIDIAYNDFN
jgi:hypothetical protein